MSASFLISISQQHSPECFHHKQMSSVRSSQRDQDSLDSSQDQPTQSQPQIKLEEQQLANYNDKLQKLSGDELLRKIKAHQIEMVSSRYRTPADAEPTYREVHECIQLLQKQMPEKDVYKIAKLLRNHLVKNQNNRGDYNGMTREAHIKQLKKKMRQPRKFYTRDLIKEKKYMTDEEELRFNQKRLVAKTLCDRGYGISYLEDQVAESKVKSIPIDRQRYSDVANSVITDAYRRLELFLIEECHRSIKPLNRYQMSALYSFLCRCRTHLAPEDSNTFLKFVRLVFGISNTSVPQEAAIKLYLSIQKALKTKIGEKRLDRVEERKRLGRQMREQQALKFQRNEFQRLWTQELYESLLLNFLGQQHLGRLKQGLALRFPQRDHLFSVDSVKSKLFKVLRMAIKKLIYYAYKYQEDTHIEIHHLNGQKTRLVLRCPNSLDLRLMLADLYLKTECKARELHRLVAALNQYLIVSDEYKMHQVIESLNQGNVSDKIQHNLSITKSKLLEGRLKYVKKEIIVKGTERNYHHIVSIQDGNPLHFYRKVDPNPLINVTKLPLASLPKIEDVDNDKILSIPNKELNFDFTVPYEGRGPPIREHETEKQRIDRQLRERDLDFSEQQTTDNKKNKKADPLPIDDDLPCALQLKIKEQMEKWLGAAFKIHPSRSKTK